MRLFIPMSGLSDPDENNTVENGESENENGVQRRSMSIEVRRTSQKPLRLCVNFDKDDNVRASTRLSQGSNAERRRSLSHSPSVARVSEVKSPSSFRRSSHQSRVKETPADAKEGQEKRKSKTGKTPPPLYLVTDPDATEDITLSSLEQMDRLIQPEDVNRTEAPRIETNSIVVPNSRLGSIVESSTTASATQPTSASDGNPRMWKKDPARDKKTSEDNVMEGPSEVQLEVKHQEELQTGTSDELAAKQEGLSTGEANSPAENQEDGRSLEAPQATTSQPQNDSEGEKNEAGTSEAKSLDLEKSKELARKLLQEATERHRRQAQRMMARYGETDDNDRNVSALARLRSERGLRWIILAVAVALIALVVRRIIIMSTTGPH